MISLQDISFITPQGEQLLKDLSLQVATGECVVITGPSGSGKTTLGRILNGLIPHFYEGKLVGKINIAGHDTKTTPLWQLSQNIASVFQDPKSQFFTSITEDELVFEMENYGVESKQINSRLEHILNTTGLQLLRHQPLDYLSSGQKQQVAIAATQLIEPELFIMDEPSANLDLHATAELEKTLLQLKAQYKTMVIIEHRLHYLMNIADRILYMKNGRIEQSFTPEELKMLSNEVLISLGLRSPILEHGHLHLTKYDNKPLFTIDKITIQYKKHAKPILNHFTLALPRGQVTALIGHNGAGKTTLARNLTGLIKERSGTIKLNAETLPPNKRMTKVWFVMQDTVYQLFTDSVWHEILLTHPEETEKAGRILQQLQLWHLKDRHPATLSGGEKQRLVLAVGLMQNATLFILDEPTSGLDGFNLTRVANLITTLAKNDCHVLVITHDPELVASCCHRIVRLHEGQIAEEYVLESITYTDIIKMMQQI
ncbi:ABC transporter ATP-binding protein [Lysinibacillus sp. NPDC047702]|uniref:ABC transporter ATP-binding protein n=1 Tax=unclassified Lysinibacillus TaxID=2636778 RepID=UPI003D003037